MTISSPVDTSSVNPIIKKARWIVAKLKHAGSKGLLPEERVFIAELSRRAFVQQDRTARQLVEDIQKAHLEFTLTLSTRP
jgi:hypothetical protein